MKIYTIQRQKFCKIDQFSKTILIFYTTTTAVIESKAELPLCIHISLTSICGWCDIFVKINCPQGSKSSGIEIFDHRFGSYTSYQTWIYLKKIIENIFEYDDLKYWKTYTFSKIHIAWLCIYTLMSESPWM